MREGINGKTFSNFKFNMYTKLMENYNIEHVSDYAVGNGNITEVCACVDNKDWEITVAALSDGSIYQFYADMTGDSDFLSRRLSITGEKLAIGLCGNQKVYLFAVRNNKLYYTRETKNGSNIFESEMEAEIGNIIDGRTIEKVIVRGLEDGLAVGLILKNSKNSYEFAVSYLKDNLDDFEIEFYNQETDKFIFTGEDYSSLKIVKTGTTYIKLHVSTQTAEFFKNQDSRKILDLQWAEWRDGTNATFVLLADENTDVVTMAIVKEDAANKKVEFKDILSQNGLETFLLTSYHSKRKEEIHLLALGNKCLYHTLAVKGNDGSISYNTLMPIAGNVKDASFTSDTTGRVTMYLVKENEINITQRRYNKYTGEYMENIMYLPALAGRNVRKESCYSTEIKITDLNGVPLVCSPVTIWAREEVYLETPSGLYMIGKNNRASLKTDFKGCITFKQQVNSLNTNMIFLRFDNLMEEGTNIAIDQMAVIHKKLENISSDELIKAKTATGYLLPDNIRNDIKKVNEIVEPIKKAAKMVEKKVSGSSVFGACVLSDADIEKEYFSQNDDADYLFHVGLGDLFWGSRESIIPINNTYASNDGLVIEYVLNGAKMVYKFVSKTINQFFNFIEIIFNKIGVAFKKLFEWLGFVFNWQDILRSKKAVKYLFNKQLSYFKSQSGKWSDLLSSNIDNVKLNAHKTMTSFANVINGKSFFGYANEQEVENADITEAMSNNFVQDKLFGKSSGIKIDSQSMMPYDIQEENTDGLLEKLEKYVSDLQSNETLKKEMESIKSDYSTSGSFFSNLFSDLIKGLDIAVQLILTGVKELAAIAFSMVDDILDAFSNFANQKVEIPYISNLYRYISGGDDLTLLDVIALIIAIPVTVCYKMIKNAAPFDCDAKVAEYCSELDKKLSENCNSFIQAQSWTNVIDKVIGAVSGTYYYLLNAVIDGDIGVTGAIEKFFDISCLICELIYAFSALPVFNGSEGTNSWLLFIWGALGLLLDAEFYRRKKMNIDRDNNGAYITSGYGFVHFLLAAYVVTDEISTMKGYDVVGNVAPCFAEMFKFTTVGDLTEIAVTLDIVVAFAVLITGFMGVLCTNDVCEKTDFVSVSI